MDIPAGDVEIGVETAVGTGAGTMETTNEDIKTGEMFGLHRD